MRPFPPSVAALCREINESGSTCLSRGSSSATAIIGTTGPNAPRENIARKRSRLARDLTMPPYIRERIKTDSRREQAAPDSSMLHIATRACPFPRSCRKVGSKLCLLYTPRSEASQEGFEPRHRFELVRRTALRQFSTRTTSPPPCRRESVPGCSGSPLPARGRSSSPPSTSAPLLESRGAVILPSGKAHCRH